MKFRWDKKYLYWGLTAFIVIIASVSFFMLLDRFDAVLEGLDVFFDVMMPIILGGVMAYLLTPLMNFFDEKIIKLTGKKHKSELSKRRRTIIKMVAIFFTLLLFFSFIMGFVFLVVPQIVESLRTILQDFPIYIANINESISTLLAENEEIETFVTDTISNFSETIFEGFNFP